MLRLFLALLILLAPSARSFSAELFFSVERNPCNIPLTYEQKIAVDYSWVSDTVLAISIWDSESQCPIDPKSAYLEASASALELGYRLKCPTGDVPSSLCLSYARVTFEITGLTRGEYSFRVRGAGIERVGDIDG